VSADGHPIAVYSKRPAAPWGSVVLVHGRTWSALPDFDLQAPGARVSLMDNLAAEGLAVYALDLRGYGATPRDATGFLTPARAADDLAAVLRFVAAADPDLSERPAVLGWSLGARVAALAAQRHPDLARALVLYGSPCERARVGPPPATDPGPPARQPNTAEAARSDFITPAALEPGVADAFVAEALAADPVKADWREQDTWAATDFRAVKAPILAIHGDRDPIVDAACLAERLTAAPGGVATEVLSGYDHAAHLERAAPRFVALVVAFLRGRDLTR
jgi:pimeloyl-ACP methyl ester carboxylesterase